MSKIRHLAEGRADTPDNDPKLEDAIQYIEIKKRHRKRNRYLNVGRKKLPTGMRKVQVEIYVYASLINAKGGKPKFKAFVNNMINDNRNNCLNITAWDE